MPICDMVNSVKTQDGIDNQLFTFNIMDICNPKNTISIQAMKKCDSQKSDESYQK